MTHEGILGDVYQEFGEVEMKLGLNKWLFIHPI